MLRTFYVFFFTDPATTEIYTLSLHDALPILGVAWRRMRVTTLFVAGYLAIVLVWPFSPLRFDWGIWPLVMLDRKITRLNSSHMSISYAVFCLKKKKKNEHISQNASNYRD